MSYLKEIMLNDIQEQKMDILLSNNIDTEAIFDIIRDEKIDNFRIYIKSVNSCNAIRCLIEKWYPPSENQLKKNDVISDIYMRLCQNIRSDVLYINGKVTKEYPQGKFQYKFIQKNGVSFFVSYFFKKATIVLFNKKARGKDAESNHLRRR